MNLYFKCRLLSPVVLTSQAATEGFHPSLDYIPGSIFLGIVAKYHYAAEVRNAEKSKDPQRVLDLFHNGIVRYGDAHLAIDIDPDLAIDGKYSYATPFAWYRKKVEDESNPKIFVHHLIGDTDEQLKQQRQGYINASGTKLRKIDQQFSIKSAYDAEKRRSLDEQMYGYHALPAGLTFLFRVTIAKEKAAAYQDLIESTLNGKQQQIGRSRSAEYGLVELSQVKEDTFILPNSTAAAENELVLYAASNWCFHNDYGFPTTQITPAALGLQTGKVDWQKSQLRFRRYQSFNAHRRNLNPAAMVVEKGSVLVLTGVEETPGPELFVGNWSAEGFGHCLVNPEFLKADNAGQRPAPEEKIAESDLTTPILPLNGKSADSTTQILQLLSFRAEREQKAKSLRRAVADHNHDYVKISNSQWGMLRGIAKIAGDKQGLYNILFGTADNRESRKVGVLLRGASATDWEKNNNLEALRAFLDQSDNALLALDRLADKMQKQ